MKKLAMILVVLMIVGIQAAFGNYEPCAPYQQSRTISQIEEILKRDGLYYDNLRAVYAEVYNALTGKNIQATKNGMEEMLQKTILIEKSFVKPEMFENGVKVGSSIEFTDLIGAESDYWLAAISDQGKILDVFGKAACLNPQRKRKSSEGKKLTEALVVDTIKTKIVNKVTTYDSICHIEYRTEQEPRPREVVYVSVRDNYAPYYSYGFCTPIFYNPFMYCGGRPFINIVRNTYVNVNNTSINNNCYRNDYHSNNCYQQNPCGPTPGYGGANSAGEVRNGGNFNHGNNGDYRNGNGNNTNNGNRNGGYNGNGNNGYQGSSRGTNVRVSTISEQSSQQFRTRQSGNQNFEKSASVVNQNNQNRTSNYGNQNARTSQSRQSDNQNGQFNYGRPARSSQVSQSRQSNYGNQNQMAQTTRTRQSSNQSYLKSGNVGNQQSGQTNYSNQSRSSNYNNSSTRSSGYSNQSRSSYNGGSSRSSSSGYSGSSQSRPSSGGYGGGNRR